MCIPAGKDGTSTDKEGNTTTCKDGNCTTRKPDGTTTEKPKADFCAENPENELCKKEPESTFSGSCEAVFTCKGDVLQCAMAKEQYQRNCQFFQKESPESALYDFVKAQPQSDVLSVDSTTVDLAAHIDASPIITGSCPADVSVTVAGKEIKFQISQYCPYFNYLGLIIMAMTAITCLRILAKD